MNRPIRIVYSYPHEDRRLLEELVEHFTPLRDSGRIDDWYDKDIGAGDWEKRIREHIENADIVLLLVSARFLGSEYCWKVEWPLAQKQWKERGLAVYPIVLRPFSFGATPLAVFNALPPGLKPVAKWRTRDDAWELVVEAVARELDRAALRSSYYGKAAEGTRAILQRTVKPAPFIDDLSRDTRRGLTLIARPPEELAKALLGVNNRLKGCDRAQFYYGEERFHFAIIAVTDGQPGYAPGAGEVDRYKAVIQETLREFGPFKVEFLGVCATPAGVIAKGYPYGATVEELRALLRRRIREQGLGGDLEPRGQVEWMHITMARFTQPPKAEIVRLLEDACERHLGTMVVEDVQLVRNDFYFSAEKTEVLAEFPPKRGRGKGVVGLPEVIHNLPVKPAYFVGRQEGRQSVEETIEGSQSRPVVVSGFGGIGKSTLAKMVAWGYVERGKPFRFVAWIDLRGYQESQGVTLDFVLDSIARAADAQSKIPSLTSVEDKKAQVTELLSEMRSLLVLDNYESLRKNPDREKQVADLLDSFGHENIRVLITTRQLGALRGLTVRNVPVPQMTLSESEEFMRGLGPAGSLLTDRQRRAIWQALCGLPKYMAVAVDQLRYISFEQWEATFVSGRVVRQSSDRIFKDLFGFTWENVLSGELRSILLATTYFVGYCPATALQAVSGLDEDQFTNAMADVPEAYIERSDADSYLTHPLMHTFCQGKLGADEHRSFAESSRTRFVQYYLNRVHEASLAFGDGRVLQQAGLKAAEPGQGNQFGWEKELRNILAGATLAEDMARWEDVIDMRSHLGYVLRTRGYWTEYHQLAQRAAAAARKMKNNEVLAQCMIYDLAWLALREENVEAAKECLKEAMDLFPRPQRVEHWQYLAQATRHMGKASLLEGLDEWYQPNDSWPDKYKEACRFYNKSLRLRQRLSDEGQDERESIADMYMDLGRLYWLNGMYLARRTRKPATTAQAGKSFREYKRSEQVSRRGLAMFKKLKSKRGIAKAWGNIATAALETAKLWRQRGRNGDAERWTKAARGSFARDWTVAKGISREDEMAYAQWGLAETHKLLAELHRAKGGEQQALENLRKAHAFALDSYTRYCSLAGPRDRLVTQRLIQEIEGKISGNGLHPAGCK